MKSKLILVTGGLGFIGKHFVKSCLELGHFVTNVDAVNYAADRFANEEFKAHTNYRHLHADIAELSHLPLAILAVVAGWSRWLEVRLAPDHQKIPAYIWPICFALIGLVLLNYREA